MVYFIYISQSFHQQGMLILSALLLVTVGCCCNAQKPNVLFLVSDDMRPEIGAYMGKDFPTPVFPHIITPNLDKLAARSLLLKRAYVQQVYCLVLGGFDKGLIIHLWELPKMSIGHLYLSIDFQNFPGVKQYKHSLKQIHPIHV